MPMPKHGSTIDAIVVPKNHFKSLCAKPPRRVKLTAENWGDGKFVDASLDPNDPAKIDKKTTDAVNDTYYVEDPKKVKFLTASDTYTDAAGNTGIFAGWYHQHDLVLAAQLPPAITKKYVLPVNGYFRAVAVYQGQ